MPTTTNLSEATLGRLSKSVRQEIERLVREVDYWKGKAGDGPADSNTYAGRIVHAAEFPGRPLGKNTKVLFVHGEDERESIEGHVDGHGWVDLRSNDGPLHIEPRGTNGIRVRAYGERRSHFEG